MNVVGLARTLPEGFEYRFIQADVTDPEQLSAGIKGLKLRRVYGLINCAGVASMNLFMTTPPATVRRVFEVNALGTIYTCAALLPAMIRNGEGRIISFSSIAAKIGLEGEAVYVASKAVQSGGQRNPQTRSFFTPISRTQNCPKPLTPNTGTGTISVGC